MLLRGRAGVTCGVPQQLTSAIASTTSFAMPEQPLPRRASCMVVMLGICTVAMLPTDFQVLQGTFGVNSKEASCNHSVFQKDWAARSDCNYSEENYQVPCR